MFAVLDSYTKCVCVCVCVCSYCVAFLKVKLDVHIYLKYDKNMEQSLVKLIHFWEWSMINIVDGFQRKAIELMNNVNKIIKIRSTLDLRKVVFNNRVYKLFVA